MFCDVMSTADFKLIYYALVFTKRYTEYTLYIAVAHSVLIHSVLQSRICSIAVTHVNLVPYLIDRTTVMSIS